MIDYTHPVLSLLAFRTTALPSFSAASSFPLFLEASGVGSHASITPLMIFHDIVEYALQPAKMPK